jgi:hypothetical protein
VEVDHKGEGGSGMIGGVWVGVNRCHLNRIRWGMPILTNGYSSIRGYHNSLFRCIGRSNAVRPGGAGVEEAASLCCII